MRGLMSQLSQMKLKWLSARMTRIEIMARLDADELFPRVVVELLRLMIHNILTLQAAGKDNPKNPDEEVLAFAVSENRAVLTLNRRYFIRLHSLQSDHAAIIVCRGEDDLTEWLLTLIRLFPHLQH
jgi:predicted nuclease of predicted toxin-antitoxin system